MNKNKMRAYIELNGDSVDGFDMIEALRSTIRALQNTVQKNQSGPLVMSAEIEVGEIYEGGKVAKVLVGDADALDELHERMSEIKKLSDTASNKPADS